MQDRPANNLLLQEQACTHLNLASKTDGVDPPITEDLRSARPDDLPVVRFGTAAHRKDRTTSLRKSNQVEPAVRVEVLNIKNVKSDRIRNRVNSASAACQADPAAG